MIISGSIVLANCEDYRKVNSVYRLNFLCLKENLLTFKIEKLAQYFALKNKHLHGCNEVLFCF